MLAEMHCMCVCVQRIIQARKCMLMQVAPREKERLIHSRSLDRARRAKNRLIAAKHRSGWLLCYDNWILCRRLCARGEPRVQGMHSRNFHRCTHRFAMEIASRAGGNEHKRFANCEKAQRWKHTYVFGNFHILTEMQGRSSILASEKYVSRRERKSRNVVTQTRLKWKWTFLKIMPSHFASWKRVLSLEIDTCFHVFDVTSISNALKRLMMSCQQWQKSKLLLLKI